jgi:hypothetical protein
MENRIEGQMNNEKSKFQQRSILCHVLIGLVVAAVLLRLVITLILPRTIKWDEASYVLLASNFFTGNGFTQGVYPEVHFPPLWPLILGIFYAFAGDFEQASNLAYALFGGLLLLPGFAIAQRIYGRETAWVTAVLLTIFPALSVSVLYWGTMIEPFYLCLFYGAVAAFLVGLEENRLGMVTAAGLLLGLAYLARTETVVYVGAFFIFALVWLRTRKAWLRFGTWFPFGAFVLSFLLFAMPYLWYLHVQTGQWVLTGKVNAITWAQSQAYVTEDWKTADQVEHGLDSSGERVNWFSPDRFQQSLLWTVLSHPEDIMHRMITNAFAFKDKFFGKHVFWYGLVPLIILALFKEPWDRCRLRREGFLLTILLVQLLMFLPFHYLDRYFAPVFPVLLMWTARGTLHLGSWAVDTLELVRGRSVPGWPQRTILRYLPAAMVVLCMLLLLPGAARRGFESTAFGPKEAGLWLREHAPAEAGVISRELAVAVYSGRRWIPSPHTDWASFMRYARAHNAAYLVLTSWEIANIRPQLAFLRERGAPELELVFKFEAPYEETLVYHITSVG